MSDLGRSRTRKPRVLACLTSIVITLVATPAFAQSWPGYGHDPQHTLEAVPASAAPGKILWSTPVDTEVQRSGSDIYSHYGSPMVTRLNTVLVPVKTGAQSNFQVEAHSGATGKLLWTQTSGWSQPPNFNWTCPFGGTLTPKDRYLVMPDAGGSVLVRTFPDTPGINATRWAFVGLANYNNNPTAFANAIQICTPITSDTLGNLYFGYYSSGAALPGYPNGIPSGLARLSSTGVGSFVSVTALAGTPGMTQVAYNCAPALSNDGSIVYVAVSNGSNGYLCSANSTNLAPINSVYLLDSRSYLNGNQSVPASVNNETSGTPTVGPDGDVYFGVLEYNLPSHNDRGWMLHFDSTLKVTKTPGSFGWDDTPSIVPSTLVPSYTGTSKYLILTKYNDYADFGIGTGENKVAILDPNATQPDLYFSWVPVMKEVITVLGVTPNTAENLPGVREWCINSAAIDSINKCALINSEDGHVYRWDFTSNSLTFALNLQPPTGEAYTPTVVGPDGSVYAINNATLFCCVAAPPSQRTPVHLPGLGPLLLDESNNRNSAPVKPRRVRP